MYGFLLVKGFAARLAFGSGSLVMAASRRRISKGRAAGAGLALIFVKSYVFCLLPHDWGLNRSHTLANLLSETSWLFTILDSSRALCLKKESAPTYRLAQ